MEQWQLADIKTARKQWWMCGHQLRDSELNMYYFV